MNNHDDTSGCVNCSPDGKPRLAHKMLTGKFGLLGERLSHSFSPLIHSWFADYEYKLYEKPPEEVESFLRNGDFDGLNVTIPYKKTVFSFCSDLSDSAKKTGSVNTIIRRKDGGLIGENTDCYGFAYMLGNMDVEASGKKALVLGGGGASRAVQAVLRELGAGEIVVVSRTGEDNYQNIEKHFDARIVINATPVGMYPNNGESPMNIKDFKSCEAVLDLIYNPAKTAILLDSEDIGIPCANGLSMLVAQAKKASEIFLGNPLPESVIDDITDKISRMTRNVVLIGMPGCGKSTIGERLAAVTGRVFFDTDAMVAERAGKSLPCIFEEDGEEVFRRLETDILKEVSAKSGCVIATGGGIVKNAENRRYIRQNSTAVYLDRDIGELSSDGRPLSQQNGVKSLAAQRLPLYRQWGDFVVSVCGVSETVLKIKELLVI